MKSREGGRTLIEKEKGRAWRDVVRMCVTPAVFAACVCFVGLYDTSVTLRCVCLCVTVQAPAISLTCCTGCTVVQIRVGLFFFG